MNEPVHPEPVAIPDSDRDPERRYTPEGFEVPAPSDNDVLYEVEDGIAWITLNRPLVLNAVDWSVQRGLGRAVAAIEADDDVRSVILRGAGRAFCAGGDLQSSPRPDDGVETPGTLELVQRLWHLPKPVIAAVRGHAVGQGVEIAGMCDITIAAEDAKFGEIQIRHGFGPPMLISPFLTGLKAAKELMMSGDIFDAQEALRMGLVNRVVPTAEVFAAAEAMARRFASLPPSAVALNKLLVNRVYELAGLREAMDYQDDPVIRELSGATRGDSVSSERLATLREEGWDAFKEQRDEAFRGT